MISFVTTKPIRIDCNKIFFGTWSVIGEVVTCEMKQSTFIVTDKTSVVDKLSFDPGVTGIFIGEPSELYSFPTGFKSFFPNVKAISLNEQPMKTIDSNSLKEFGDDLVSFESRFGKISSISRDTFKHNKNLRYIHFKRHPIKFIEPRFFENIIKIESLEEVDMTENLCINQKMSRNNFLTSNWIHTCNDRTAFVRPNQNLQNDEISENCGKTKVTKGLVTNGKEFVHGSMPW